ncbi:MAG: hypothetical protein KI790_12380, partial [Cyclobacteriaceae bacterium]|nr:hypothetical protein [Cyclobacteriaceae bacterium HetDA_MAG_MS6]
NQPNAWAVMGLDISPNEKHLWACTAALPEFEAYADNDKGKSSILKYDLKTGKLLQTWVEPGDHVFGDLIVNKQGDVFVSDGTANKIYRIDRKKNELTEFLDCSEDIYNLQGLAFDRDESFLYVSDYITGIFRINMTAKDIEKVALPEDISPKGIDGLYWYKNRLLAIQNGTTPKRVWDLLLNEDGSEVTSITMVARGGKDLNEPTQGIIIEDQFYFLANSPWGSYDKKGNFNVDPSSATQIRKYDLEGNK